jgi:hypothetical protein
VLVHSQSFEAEEAKSIERAPPRGSIERVERASSREAQSIERKFFASPSVRANALL